MTDRQVIAVKTSKPRSLRKVSYYICGLMLFVRGFCLFDSETQRGLGNSGFPCPYLDLFKGMGQTMLSYIDGHGTP